MVSDLLSLHNAMIVDQAKMHNSYLNRVAKKKATAVTFM